MTRAAILILSAFCLAFGQSETGPRFEVASVRPSAPGTRGMFYHLPGDRLKAQGITLNFLAGYAWDIPSAQITGMPKWASEDHFDLEAIPQNAADAPAKELESPRKKAMVRALLGERFRFKARVEQLQTTTYSLVIAKGGAKMRPNSEAPYEISRFKTHTEFRKVSMAMLAKFLSDNVRRDIGRMVFNKTGLEGTFDFDLAWAPATAAESDLPSIFGAIEELGLKLEPDHGLVPFLVVEHAEPPTPN